MPIKEGEHVYVVFEDNITKSHGLWVTRIPEHKKIDQRNLVLGSKKYDDNAEKNQVSKVGLKKVSEDTDIDTKDIKQSPNFARETIKPFTFRTGDYGLEGSNNTLILMSRDRKDKPDSGEKEKAGALFLVAGRKDEEQLNWKDDLSYLVISMNSDADGNMDIQAGENKGAAAVIAAKSDEIRIVAREGMKIIVEDGEVYMKSSGKINIESDKDIIVKSNSKVQIDAPNTEVGGADDNAVLYGPLSDAITQIMNRLKC